ncbi:MAG: hypothetical protein AAF736_18825 [Pseudomonadota bacterium]
MLVRFLGLSALLLAVFLPVANAEPPSTLTYQGRLGNPGGSGITADFPMVFALYDVPSGGTELWSETQTVRVDNGNFSVQLGSVTPLVDELFVSNLWLGLRVAGSGELMPRPAISAAPFAFRARSLMRNTIHVSADGDEATNATRLLSLVAGITDATEDNTYLVRLDAGRFDLGSATLTLPDFVSLEGAGPLATEVFSTATGCTIEMGNQSAVRQLAGRNEGTGGVFAGGAFNCGIGAFGKNRVWVERAVGVASQPGDTVDTRAGILMWQTSNVELDRVRGLAEGGDNVTGIIAVGNDGAGTKLDGLLIRDSVAVSNGSARQAQAFRQLGYNDAEINGLSAQVDGQSGTFITGALFSSEPSASVRDLKVEISGEGNNVDGFLDGVIVSQADGVSFDGVEINMRDLCSTSGDGYSGFFVSPLEGSTDITRITNLSLRMTPNANCPGLAIGLVAHDAALIVNGTEISITGDTLEGAVGFLNLLRDDGTGNPREAQGLTTIDDVNISVQNNNAPAGGSVDFGLVGRTSMAIKGSTISSNEVAVQFENTSPIGPASPPFTAILTHNTIIGSVGVAAIEQATAKVIMSRVLGGASASGGTANVICSANVQLGPETFLPDTCPN